MDDAYGKLRADLLDLRRSPGHVTKAELDELLARHPEPTVAAPAVDGAYADLSYDPSLYA